MALMTPADGDRLISEYVHEKQFQHGTQLAKMGVRRYRRGTGCTLRPTATTRLRGGRGERSSRCDIRSGAAL